MFAVDFFYQEPVHIEGETWAQLVGQVHDFYRLFVYPVKEINVITDPILGTPHLEIIPIDEKHGVTAFEIKKV